MDEIWNDVASECGSIQSDASNNYEVDYEMITGCNSNNKIVELSKVNYITNKYIIVIIISAIVIVLACVDCSCNNIIIQSIVSFKIIANKYFYNNSTVIYKKTLATNHTFSIHDNKKIISELFDVANNSNLDVIDNTVIDYEGISATITTITKNSITVDQSGTSANNNNYGKNKINNDANQSNDMKVNNAGEYNVKSDRNPFNEIGKFGKSIEIDNLNSKPNNDSNSNNANQEISNDVSNLEADTKSEIDNIGTADCNAAADRCDKSLKESAGYIYSPPVRMRGNEDGCDDNTKNSTATNNNNSTTTNNNNNNTTNSTYSDTVDSIVHSIVAETNTYNSSSAANSSTLFQRIVHNVRGFGRGKFGKKVLRINNELTNSKNNKTIISKDAAQQ